MDEKLKQAVALGREHYEKRDISSRDEKQRFGTVITKTPSV